MNTKLCVCNHNSLQQCAEDAKVQIEAGMQRR